MEQIELHLFHGYLGLPQDWNSVVSCLDQDMITVKNHNLWDDLNGVKAVDFRSWSQFKNSQISDSSLKKMAVGYSLGGRMLMHLDLSQFENVLLIAAHPGLVDVDKKHTRLANDLLWCDKILNMDWEVLMGLWNQQEIFSQDRIRPLRDERNFDREKLSLVMQAFSLSQQQPKDEILSENKERVQWAYGARDQKFSQLRPRMESLLGKDHIMEIPETGHGCLFEKPEIIVDWIKSQ